MEFSAVRKDTKQHERPKERVVAWRIKVKVGMLFWMSVWG
jgi:hypothetical protein